MLKDRHYGGVLRGRDEADQDVTPVELFFDPNLMPVRLMLVAVMFASLFMSVAIPEAFGDLMFAGAYVAIHLARAAFAFVSLRLSLRGRHPLTRTVERTLSWHALAGVLRIAVGGSKDRDGPAVGARSGINLGAPLIGYYLPGLGRSRTSEWALNGAHFTERFQLFIIIDDVIALEGGPGPSDRRA